MTAAEVTHVAAFRSAAPAQAGPAGVRIPAAPVAAEARSAPGLRGPLPAAWTSGRRNCRFAAASNWVLHLCRPQTPLVNGHAAMHAQPAHHRRRRGPTASTPSRPLMTGGRVSRQRHFAPRSAPEMISSRPLRPPASQVSALHSKTHAAWRTCQRRSHDGQTPAALGAAPDALTLQRLSNRACRHPA